MKKLYGILLGVFLFLASTMNVYALNVQQESLTVEDKSTTIIVNDEGIGNLEIHPKIKFQEVGDYITYKLVLKNTDGKKYKIESITDDNINRSIQVNYQYSKEMNTKNKEIRITIKYHQKTKIESLKSIQVNMTLMDEDDQRQNVIVNNNPGINPNWLDEDGNLPKIPKTHFEQIKESMRNHVGLSILILIIMVTTILYIIKKGNRKNGIILLLLLFMVVPTIVFSRETKSIIFKINFGHASIRVEHQVTFDSTGGSVVPEQIVENNHPVTRPTNPTKEGYDFVKWVNEENETFDFRTFITKDIELKAVWEKKEFSIHYHTDGGTTIPSEVKKYEETFTKPTDPTKTGHNFIKWVDENNNDYDFSTKATKDIELTAVWEKKEYVVTFDSVGGSTVGNQTIKYQDKVMKPTNPTRDKYDFVKWLDEENNEYSFDTQVTKNMTLKAEWIEVFTVTYDSNGGSSVDSEKVRKNEKASKPEKPTKEGYNFVKWLDGTNEYDFTKPVTSDKTLKAEWKPIEYTITYDLDGGTVSAQNKTTYTIETDTFTLNNPTKDKHVFKGWKKNNETTVNKNVTITKGTTGNLEFEAIFNPIYTVTYDVNGGNAITPTSKQIENGEEIGTLPTPTKDHYDFVGWYIGNDKIESNHVVNDNITLVAKYKAIEYTITYKLNGGTVNPANKEKYTIETDTFPLTNPTPPNNEKRFKGWKKNNETTINENVTITKGTTGNLEFEAIYETLFTVTFDSTNAGTIPDSNKTRRVWENEQIGNLPSNPNVTDPLKIFNCWGVNNVCIDATYTVTGDTTVVAIYKDKTTTTVINDLNGKNVTDTCTQASYVASLDYNGNRRYVGRCPKNYVYFNCDRNKGSQFDIYSTEAEEDAARCELWRIIGTFDISNGTKTEKRTKIVRASSIGNFVLNSDNNSGTPQWGKNALSIRLNNTGSGGYLNNDTSYGLKNPDAETGIFKRYYKAQDYIEDALWHIGNPTGTSNDVAKRFAYTQGNDLYVGQKTVPLDYVDGDTNVLTWKGKVGLPNISDFMFASDKDVTYSHCGRTNLSVYSGNNCVDASWMPYTRLMSVVGNNGGSRMLSTWNGTFRYVYNGSYPNYAEPTAPSVYLKANVTIKDGDGSYATPFILGIDE